MTYGSRYRVQLRRRRQKKTDYQARKAFVVSGKARLVARSSLKHTIVQIVIAKPIGDEVIASAHSKELVNKYGWKAATGNIPGAYLTGLLCGLKAKKNRIADVILDIGLITPTKGAKVFAAMSGVINSGVDVPHDDEKIVKERTQGYHIQDYAESLGQPAEYAPIFSVSIAKGVSPDKFSEHFFEVRNAILTAFGMPIPKPEPKPVKAKKPEAKPKAPIPTPKAAKVVPEAKTEEKKQAPVEAKKPEVQTEAKPAPAPQPKPEAKPPTIAEEAKTAEKAEAKPKGKEPKAQKTTAKKAARPKAKAEKIEVTEPKAEPKPKRASKKTKKAEEATAIEAKTSKKTGGKKA